jgi:hypothetical protein
MSSRLQQTLLQHEETPPQGVWGKIAAELDDSALELKFPSQLYNYTAVPPIGTWDKIADSLDSHSYAAKLYDIEVAPPAATWAAITNSMDAGKEAAIPEQRRLSPMLRYAAAASIIALITFGALQLTKKKGQQSDLATNEKNSPVQDSPTPVTTQDNNTIGPSALTAAIAASDEARNDAALEESKKTFAKLDLNKHSRLKNVADFYFADAFSTVQSRGIDVNYTAPIAEPPTEDSDASNRYIVLRTPEGNIIRMSKKLGDLVCCISGEEQDENCKGQMKKWREKIATSCGNHSPGNFIDILSLVNSLQDDNH